MLNAVYRYMIGYRCARVVRHGLGLKGKRRGKWRGSPHGPRDSRPSLHRRGWAWGITTGHEANEGLQAAGEQAARGRLACSLCHKLQQVAGCGLQGRAARRAGW